jgi:hypothetical protein
MLSMSNSSWLNWDGFASSTPSISTATEGSLLRACEMPRTVMNEVPWFCVCTIVMFGVSAMKSCGRVMPADSISAALNALTARGASSCDSSRLRAVTTTSSSWNSASAAGARAGVKPAREPTAAPQSKDNFRVFMWPPPIGRL